MDKVETRHEGEILTRTRQEKRIARCLAKQLGADARGNWIGKSVKRREEGRLVRGKGMFVDDKKMLGMLHMHVVRSPYAHAISSFDISRAAAAPGVVCTLTGKEVAALVQPFIEIGPGVGQKILDYPMAVDKVQFQGEPVAAVVAETRFHAEDAAELVEVEYEPLPPVMTAEDAFKPTPSFTKTPAPIDLARAYLNMATSKKLSRKPRTSSTSTACTSTASPARRSKTTPSSPNGISRKKRINFCSNNSFPAFAAQFLSPALGVRIDQIHMQSIDIGGGFGIKITNYPYMALCALASRKIGGRPVKWIETRTEHILASAHGNERTFFDTRVALDANGVITAIESRHVDDCGAYPRYEPLGCIIWAQVLPGAYRFHNVRFDFSQIVTNKCPVGPNRGYSRMQHLWFLERVIDICGHTLGIPADTMRLRNYIQPDEFPYTTPNGCIYDSGNYPKMLEIAKNLVGWDNWKKNKRKRARKAASWHRHRHHARFRHQ